ncbi:MAG: NAD(+) synthase [Firmicutes bacterium]|nr:NAD(+) synthase [Bacillota bacterium]
MAIHRDYKKEFEERVAFIKNLLAETGCTGIVFGNSGGKDCTLVGILCKAACENTLGVMMPCESSCNFLQDKEDAIAFSEQYSIELKCVDLTELKKGMVKNVAEIEDITDTAISNIAPRLRMTTLYLIAQSRNALVAGTGNKCERFMGYFTKWGDGAYDFDPIADLTVSEIYDFLRYLEAPESIITKAPSAGLFEGQTDEGEMGVTYEQIEDYLAGNNVEGAAKEKIKRAHQITEHKRKPPVLFQNKA